MIRLNVLCLPALSAALLQAEDEPLHIGALHTSPCAEAALRRCWQQRGARSMYSSFEQYRQLLEQVGAAYRTGGSQARGATGGAEN